MFQECLRISDPGAAPEYKSSGFALAHSTPLTTESTGPDASHTSALFRMWHVQPWDSKKLWALLCLFSFSHCFPSLP